MTPNVRLQRFVVHPKTLQLDEVTKMNDNMVSVDYFASHNDALNTKKILESRQVRAFLLDNSSLSNTEPDFDDGREHGVHVLVKEADLSLAKLVLEGLSHRSIQWKEGDVHPVEISNYRVRKASLWARTSIIFLPGGLYSLWLLVQQWRSEVPSDIPNANKMMGVSLFSIVSGFITHWYFLQIFIMLLSHKP